MLSDRSGTCGYAPPVAKGERRASDETATLVRDVAPLPLGAVVRVVGVKAQPQAFRLSAGSCVVGAGAGANLLVPESSVSRRHVELTLVPEGVTVADLGSRNGTFYLGQRVEKIVLALGSRIKAVRSRSSSKPTPRAWSKGSRKPTRSIEVCLAPRARCDSCLLF